MVLKMKASVNEKQKKILSQFMDKKRESLSQNPNRSGQLL